MREIELRLSDISLDDVYAFSYPHLPERYAGLQEKYPGLPLLVVDRAQRVVSGHDYRLLLRQRGETQAPALQLDLSVPDALLLNYNILHCLFGLNLYEKLLFIKKITPLCPIEDIQRRAELNFALSDHLLENLDMLLTESFRFCLATGRLGLKAALRLADMPEEDRLAMIALLRACRFSENQQAQLIQLLEETAFREKKSWAGIVAASGLTALLQREMPQKKIIEALQAARYPAYSRMENDWHIWQKKMAPKNVVLTHTPLFAKEEIQITLTAKNMAAAEKLLAKLKKLF
ncbi:MAG: hypothetical protein KJ808_02160 [Acidobacteria bacterium]|nr:hypothetical protein [Acidobacteriota bacterium]MBU4404062.1 hypothetical protein [Acidobacteriota bacterium]MCG2811220.1 hypothetical protein [Candidatus Aminicenantes bacterium]